MLSLLALRAENHTMWSQLLKKIKNIIGIWIFFAFDEDIYFEYGLILLPVRTRFVEIRTRVPYII
jgi:hypothetical protein